MSYKKIYTPCYRNVLKKFILPAEEMCYKKICTPHYGNVL